MTYRLSPLADPTVQDYRSGFFRRDSPPRPTSIVVRSVGLPICGDIVYRGLRLDYVSFRQIRPLVPPFPPVGTVAAPFVAPWIPPIHHNSAAIR